MFKEEINSLWRKISKVEYLEGDLYTAYVIKDGKSSLRYSKCKNRGIFMDKEEAAVEILLFLEYNKCNKL